MNTKFYFWLSAAAFSGIAVGQVATPLRVPAHSTLDVGTLAAQAATPTPASERPAASLSQGPSSGAPAMLTLKDALALAQANAPQVLAALSDVRTASEDLRQARAGQKPSLSARSEYLGTQGDGGAFPTGRFVTNDGVHVYREWAVLHEDFMASILRTGVQRASVMESLARAKADVAKRGLTATVAKAYYALLSAQRKYSTAQMGLDQAKQYLNITQTMEKGGEVARSDTVKSQIQNATQEQALRETKLAMDTARLDLAVLLYRDLNLNFNVVDDLDTPAALPTLSEINTMAEHQNPDLQAANMALRAAKLDVSIARQGYLPTLTTDFVYGIEANALALHSTVAADPLKGPQPNLGYFLTVSLNVPIWDWGTRASKVKQADLKREQANVDLTATQRDLMRNLQGFYLEAQTAREQLASLRNLVDLSSESLRLTGLRYQAGEATILELVDAQTTLLQARNSYDDGLVRYRLALMNLQTLTGAF